MWKGRKLSIEKVIIHTISKITLFTHGFENSIHRVILCARNNNDIIQKLAVSKEDEFLNVYYNEFTRST